MTQAEKNAEIDFLLNRLKKLRTDGYIKDMIVIIRHQEANELAAIGYMDTFETFADSLGALGFAQMVVNKKFFLQDMAIEAGVLNPKREVSLQGGIKGLIERFRPKTN